MKKRGFTLIELLVVVVIISLLLAIVVPALRKAKASVRFLVCKTNLRELVTAVNTYTVENKGVFITYKGWTASSGDRSLWINAVGNCLSNVNEVRFCPEAKTVNPERKPLIDGRDYVGDARHAWSWYTPIEKSPYAVNDRSEGSYAFNGYLYSITGAADRDVENLATYAESLDNLFSKVGAVTQPAMVPVLVDGIWPDTWPRPGELPIDNSQGSWRTGINSSTTGSLVNTTNYISRTLIDRHDKKLGVAFLDGHADQTEAVKDLELWSLRWRKNWSVPTTAQAASINTVLNARRPD